MRDLGAIPMLRSLVHSRHKMIAMGSSAALKNLDSASLGSLVKSPSTGMAGVGSSSTALLARKQKALEQEIDHTLSEMCDNIDADIASPVDVAAGEADRPSPFDRRMYRSLGGNNTSQYGRSAAPALVAKSGLPSNRQLRSSSLERSSTHRTAPTEPSQTKSIGTASPASPAPPAARLQATRSAWRSHEDEISYTSLNYEEDDQPVNYSLKYAEEGANRWASAARQPAAKNEPTESKATKTAADPALNTGEKLDSSSVKKVMVLSAYTETDLDEPEQPTDFSLRYQEDEDYIPSGDTMKTYYIEGTPYETPFSCSSAASLTDLREAGFEGSKAEEEATEKQVSLFSYFVR